MRREFQACSRNQYAPCDLYFTRFPRICKCSCKNPLDSSLTRHDFPGVRISRKSEYAIRSLVAMARQQRSWSIQELSGQEAIPVKFLEQILLTLRHAGYLSAKRGVGGGYTLRAQPSEIRVGDVIRTMDGPIAPVPCAAAQPSENCTCPDPKTCPLRLLMTEVRVEIVGMLDSKTIEDLVRMHPGNELAFEI